MLLLCSLVTVSTGSAMAVDYSAVVKSYNPSCYWRLGESSTSEPAVEEIRGRFGDYKVGNTLGLTGAIAGDNNTAVGFTGAVAGDANDSTIIIRDGLDMGTVNELTMICWIKEKTSAEAGRKNSSLSWWTSSRILIRSSMTL